MTADASLTTVVVALHAPSARLLHIIHWLALDPKAIPVREGAWRHVRRSEDGLTLVFGPAGLKRVRAGSLVDRLTDAGFRYAGGTFAVKTRTGSNEPREPKLCLEIVFAKEPDLPLAPQAALLGAALSHPVWKRGRVTLVRDDDGSWGASVDLVRPMTTLPSSVSELTFHPERGFESFVVNSP